MRFANDEKHPRVLTREALKAQGGNPLPAEITRQAARDAQAAEAPPHVPVKQPSRAEVRERRSRALPDPEAEPSPRVLLRDASPFSKPPVRPVFLVSPPHVGHRLATLENPP